MCRGLLEAMRRGRSVLLPVLVVLIAAHLAGASHSAAFGGPHAAVASVSPLYLSPRHQSARHESPPWQSPQRRSPRQHALQGSSGQAFAPQPAHRHDVDDHVDHAVDRPRPEGVAAVPVPAGTAVVSAVPAGCPWGDFAFSPRRAGGERDPSWTTDPAMNCVWRQ